MDFNSLLEKLAIANECDCEDKIVDDEEVINEAEADEQEEDDDDVKISIGFARLIGVLFPEGKFTTREQNVGKQAVRKIMQGKGDKLILIERTVLSTAFINLIPIIGNDRLIFNRLEKSTN